MRRLIDANIVLRYLLGDDPVLSERARQIIAAGAFMPVEVCCEVVYVLNGFYSVPRTEVCGFLTGFIDEVDCPDGDVLKTALAIFKNRGKLDFVDAILAAYHQVRGDEILTFDKKLNNAIKVIDETGSALL